MKKRRSDSSKCSAEPEDSGSALSLVGDRGNPSISIKKISGTIPSNPMSDRQPFVVSGQTTTTNTPAKSIEKDLEIKNSLRETLRTSQPQIYPTMTSSQLASLVRVFPLRENVEVFKTSQGELFSSISVESYEIKDHASYSLRMLKGYFLTTQAEPLQLYSFRWMNLGMMRNGLSQTLSITYRRTARGSLSSVLEEKADKKYYISETMLKKIMEKKDAHPDIRWKSGIKGEGRVAFPDDPDKPSRAITTAEGGANRMTHGIMILADLLEEKVDEKYYLSKRMVDFLKKRRGENKGKRGNIQLNPGNSIVHSLDVGKIRDSSKTFICDSGLHRKSQKRNNLIPPLRANIGAAYNNLLRQQRIRRLTPKECERLQGFPDDWTELVSDTQRYKQMGNAVSIPVVTAIGEAILNTVK